MRPPHCRSPASGARAASDAGSSRTGRSWDIVYGEAVGHLVLAEDYEPVLPFRDTNCAVSWNGHEKDPGQRIAGGADGDQAPNLLGAQDARWLDATGRALDPAQERFDVASEQAAVEGAQGIDGEVDGARRELALGDEVE